MASNPVVWFEIPTQDIARARAFYEAVLGVELTPADTSAFAPRARRCTRKCSPSAPNSTPVASCSPASRCAPTATVCASGSRQDETRFIDGPFVESREMIGGFFLNDCANRDEAVEWAARCPAARFATVEVRECAPCHQR